MDSGRIAYLRKEVLRSADEFYQNHSLDLLTSIFKLDAKSPKYFFLYRSLFEEIPIEDLINPNLLSTDDLRCTECGRYLLPYWKPLGLQKDNIKKLYLSVVLRYFFCENCYRKIFGFKSAISIGFAVLPNNIISSHGSHGHSKSVLLSREIPMEISRASSSHNRKIVLSRKSRVSTDINTSTTPTTTPTDANSINTTTTTNSNKYKYRNESSESSSVPPDEIQDSLLNNSIVYSSYNKEETKKESRNIQEEYNRVESPFDSEQIALSVLERDANLDETFYREGVIYIYNKRGVFSSWDKKYIQISDKFIYICDVVNHNIMQKYIYKDSKISIRPPRIDRRMEFSLSIVFKDENTNNSPLLLGFDSSHEMNHVYDVLNKNK